MNAAKVRINRQISICLSVVCVFFLGACDQAPTPRSTVKSTVKASEPSVESSLLEQDPAFAAAIPEGDPIDAEVLNCSANVSDEDPDALSQALFVCAANALLTAATGASTPSSVVQTLASEIGNIVINEAKSSGSSLESGNLICSVSTLLQNKEVGKRVLAAVLRIAKDKSLKINGDIGALNVAVVIRDCLLAIKNGAAKLLYEVGALANDLQELKALNRIVAKDVCSFYQIARSLPVGDAEVTLHRMGQIVGAQCFMGWWSPEETVVFFGNGKVVNSEGGKLALGVKVAPSTVKQIELCQQCCAKATPLRTPPSETTKGCLFTCGMNARLGNAEYIPECRDPKAGK